MCARGVQGIGRFDGGADTVSETLLVTHNLHNGPSGTYVDLRLWLNASVCLPPNASAVTQIPYLVKARGEVAAEDVVCDHEGVPVRVVAVNGDGQADHHV